MTSFAFNTMIGQVTSVAIPSIGGRFYILFIVCNFANAVFFWALLPETKKIPLEEMHDLFRDAPIFVPGKDMSAYRPRDLEHRLGNAKVDAIAEHIEDYEHKH